VFSGEIEDKMTAKRPYWGENACIIGCLISLYTIFWRNLGYKQFANKGAEMKIKRLPAGTAGVMKRPA
jgi:hypothetical protein